MRWPWSKPKRQPGGYVGRGMAVASPAGQLIRASYAKDPGVEELAEHRL